MRFYELGIAEIVLNLNYISLIASPSNFLKLRMLSQRIIIFAEGRLTWLPLLQDMIFSSILNNQSTKQN